MIDLFKPDNGTRMIAGYAGGFCERCHDPIKIGDSYYIMPDVNGTIACQWCVTRIDAAPAQLADAG